MAFFRSDAWRSDNCENKRSDNAIVNWKKTPCHFLNLESSPHFRNAFVTPSAPEKMEYGAK